MKKVAILTLNGNVNYGNRLQNYALQEILKKQGFEVETLWCLKFNVKKELREIKKSIKNINYLKRKAMFKRFNKKYIKIRYCTSYNHLNKTYDKFIVGSDQVWNCQFDTFDESYFLNFSEREKNMSYAASFGFDSIPELEKDKYLKGLKNINEISVRENSGKNILDSLGLKSTVLFDPTLIISKEEWEELAKKSRIKLPKKYILIYSLGTLPKGLYNNIKTIAESYNCEIIDLLQQKNKYYVTDPIDFLKITQDALLVITDSFHSTVFSIIFRKPFVVFRRNDKYNTMFDRIETLLKKLQLDKRIYNGSISKYMIKNDDLIDNRINIILRNEKDKTYNFIQNGIKKR